MKTYIIAGGSSGIGLALTRKLSNAGDKVIVMSRNGNNLKDIKNVVHHSIDFTDSTPAFPDLNSNINGIVYSPGSITLKPFKNLKPEQFISDFNINLLGAVKLINRYLDILKNAGNSSIVLYSTVAVQTGMNYHSSIAAAKGAVEGLTRSLAAEFAPNIRANCIAPSLTQTNLAERLLNSEVKMNAATDRHPLKKIGTADEIADLTEFLLLHLKILLLFRLHPYHCS